MIVVLLAIVLRMFIPVEFWYTYSVRIHEVLPSIRSALVYQLLEIPIEVRVWHLLCVTWGIGIVCNLAYKMISYGRLQRYISMFPALKWEKISEDCHFDIAKHNDVLKIKVVLCKKLSSPCLIGLKKVCLLLPEVGYNEQQLYYIVLHELMHLRNRDIVWKILVDLLCTVFWWNPIFWYIKKELFELIEIRNDMKIVNLLSEEEQIRYMECLKNAAVQGVGKDVAFGVSFSKGDLKALKRRLQLIAEKRDYCRWQQIVVVVLVFIGLFMTSAIIFEPFSFLDEDEVEGTPLTAENTFLIKNQEEYDVYIDGEYLFSTDDLTPFWGVNVYDNLEEALENEKK